MLMQPVLIIYSKLDFCMNQILFIFIYIYSLYNKTVQVLLAWEENTRVRLLRNFWPFSQYTLFFGMTIFFLINYTRRACFDLKNFYQIKQNVALSMRIYYLHTFGLATGWCIAVFWSLRCFPTKTKLNFVSVRTAVPLT